MRNYDPVKLSDNLCSYDWNVIYGSQDANIAWKKMKVYLQTCIDQMIPFHTKKVRGKPCPWLDDIIKDKMDEKDKLMRISRKTKSAHDSQAYKRVRNEVNNMIKKAKRNYHIKQLNDNEHHPQKFWSSIKNLYPSKSPKSNATTFVTNSGDISTPPEIANGFNKFFTNTVNSLKTKSIPLCNFIWRRHYMSKSRTSKRFKFKEVSVQYISKVISTLQLKKSVGMDGIPAFILKDCTNVLVGPLTHIINLSLTTGVIPTEWKTAKITPVHKSGSTSNFDNYRPISVIPAIAKVIEKTVHHQLLEYLERNKLLSLHQFGFRQKRSTQLATILFTDCIRQSVDKGKLVGAIYVDLSKAFDTLSHSRLLSKLTTYGIMDSSLTWFTNYLFERQQFVNYDGVISEKQFQTVGVPQGTILGPLLFLMYYNDLTDCLLHSHVVKYADDTCIILYVAASDASEIEKKLNEDMEEVFKWCTDNELILNMKKGKTEFMLFGTKQKINRMKKDITIEYGNEPINKVNQYKYLGTYLDTALSLNENFTKSYKKASSRLRLLQKIRPFLTTKAAKLIYQSMIVPVITYSSLINLNLTNTQLNKLKSIDRRAFNITGCKNLPSIEGTIRKNCCKTVRKCIDGRTCENFLNYFTVIEHNQNTRNKNSSLRLPATRTEYGRRSFRFQASKFYNDLPLEYRKENDFNIFVRILNKQFK